jgi:hypothetical protein
MKDIHEVVRRELTHAMVMAAEADKLSLHAEAIAFASSPQLTVVNAPVAGLEQIDFRSMLEGTGPESTPVMYWYVASEALKEGKLPLGEGFYTVVARRQHGTVELRDDKGQTVTRGDLEVCIGPGGSPVGVIARTKVSGGIDSADGSLWPPHVKVCGHVKIQKNGVTVTVKACVEAGF